MSEPRYQVFKVDPLELNEWGVLDRVEHYGICSEMTKDDAELVASALNERDQVKALQEAVQALREDVQGAGDLRPAYFEEWRLGVTFDRLWATLDALRPEPVSSESK